MNTTAEGPRANESPPDPEHARAAARHVLLVDADPLLARLIEEWLEPEGLAVRMAPPSRSAPASAPVSAPAPGPAPAAPAATPAGVPAAAGRAVAAAVADTACRLVIVDLPYPRRTGVDSIREVASRHPGVPIIALSPTIFASVDSCGSVSRALGVDCVLAKPTSRACLLSAVRRFVAP